MSSCLYSRLYSCKLGGRRRYVGVLQAVTRQEVRPEENWRSLLPSLTAPHHSADRAEDHWVIKADRSEHDRNMGSSWRHQVFYVFLLKNETTQTGYFTIINNCNSKHDSCWWTNWVLAEIKEENGWMSIYNMSELPQMWWSNVRALGTEWVRWWIDQKLFFLEHFKLLTLYKLHVFHSMYTTQGCILRDHRVWPITCTKFNMRLNPFKRSVKALRTKARPYGLKRFGESIGRLGIFMLRQKASTDSLMTPLWLSEWLMLMFVSSSDLR